MPRLNKSKKQRGGQNSGHDVHLPSEYFGVSSGRYFAPGSPELTNIPDSAYGTNFPTSHGIPIGNNMTGPALGAYPDASGMQTGGSNTGHDVQFPAEYFGNNSGRYFSPGSPELTNIPDSAYGKNFPTSHGIPIGNNMTGPALGAYPDASGMQTGGAYSKIVNPATGRKVSVFGKLGQKIIRNYLNQRTKLEGGA